MACWIITVPFIERFPRTLLVTSVVVGLFGGHSAGTRYGALGLTIDDLLALLRHRQALRQADSRLGREPAHWQKLFFTAAAFGSVGYFYLDEIYYRSGLYGSLNFAHFDVSIPEGIGIRLIVDIGALLHDVDASHVGR